MDEPRIPRRLRVLLAFCVFAVAISSAVIGPTSGASEQDAPGEAVSSAPGLGEYGRSGPISRSDIREGLVEIVSDEAIQLASSPVFANARQAWSGEIDFVGQIDYQLEFRAWNDYMSTEPGYLAQLLEDRPINAGIESYGLYLSSAEIVELQRRLELGDKMQFVVEAVTGIDPLALPEGQEPQYDDNFGGVWQDQMSGGAIVLAVVDATEINRFELAELLGGEQHLRILDGHPSWDTVNATRDGIQDNLRRLGIDAEVMIDSTSAGRKIRVETPDPSLIPGNAISSPIKGLVSVVAADTSVDLGDPEDPHSAGDQQPGLLYDADPGGRCTWGVNGHTSSFNYLVTAGHCGSTFWENQSTSTDSFNLDQGINGTFDLTPGFQFVHSIHTVAFDGKRVSSPYANDNCYHWGHCSTFIKSRAWFDSLDVNSDMTCASLGRSNTYRCGLVLELNFDSGGNCNQDRVFRAAIEAISGDSGSGLIKAGSTSGTVFDGILVCKNGTTSQIRGYQAWQVKTQLGFDFNCASSAVVKVSTAWGTCPGNNR